jgi:hypothetical protein
MASFRSAATDDRAWASKPGRLLDGSIARILAYFGSGAAAPPEVAGGGTTFGSPALGAGFSIAGSTSFGRMTPFDWFSLSLRFWAGTAGLA